MPKRKCWSLQDDRFIVMFFDAVGPMIGPHDLGVTEAQVIARAKLLRDRGGWGLLERAIRAEAEYLIAMSKPGRAPEMLDEVAESLRTSHVRLVDGAPA